MSDTYPSSAPSGGIAGGITGTLRRAEAWLDDRGRPAWIIAMILGFVLFWPIGLGLLAYMIWSKRMFSRSCNTSRHHRHDSRHDAFHAMRSAVRPSGNSAFDAYKADTIRRLQDEQEAFEAFLNRLRDAKDKREFDAFMDDRANAARQTASQAAPQAEPPVAPSSPAAGY